MMRIFENLRIGTKLALTSTLSILLVAAMIVAQTVCNANLRAINEDLRQQQTIARDGILANREKSVAGVVDEMQRLSKSAENRERMAKLKSLAGKYADNATVVAE